MCNPVVLRESSGIYNGQQQRFEENIETLSALSGSITYTYIPLVETGARLSSDELPWRAGEYIIVAQYQSIHSDIPSGEVRSTVVIEPAPLLLDIELDKKIYNAQVEVEITDVSLIGVFGFDAVVAPFYSIDSLLENPNVSSDSVPVSFSTFSLRGMDSHNYFIIQPNEPIPEEFADWPMFINVESNEIVHEVHPNYLYIDVVLNSKTKVYDGTTIAFMDDDREIFESVSLRSMQRDYEDDELYISKNGTANYSSHMVGNNISISFEGFEIDGIKSDNYVLVQPSTMIGSQGGSITPAPITLSVHFEEKIYNRDSDVSVTDITIHGLFNDDGNYINIDPYDDSEFNLRNMRVAEDVEVLLNGFEFSISGEKAFNYYIEEQPKEFIDILPKPVYLDIEISPKIFDGDVIAVSNVEIIGVLGGDIVNIKGEAKYESPNVGNNITVRFNEIELTGTHAWNYELIIPDDGKADITRASIFGGNGKAPDKDGEIEVDINGLLHIGGDLTFETDFGFDGDYEVQWLWGDNRDNIEDETDEAYKVTHDVVDEKISVYLVSKCGNYEGWSELTDYVPYTINIAINREFVPMPSDYAYFGTPGNYTAYAASNNSGFVDIRYTLQNSGIGTDTIEFTGGFVNAVTRADTGTARYHAKAVDATSGVITITASFLHRGVTVSPVTGHNFANINCGEENDESHRVTITNVGNAPTGAINLTRSGAYPDEFAASTYSIPNMDVGAKHEIDITVDLDLSPPGFVGYTFGGNIYISGSHISNVSLPFSVRVYHVWGNWGSWTQGDATNHHRTGSCTTPGCGRVAIIGTTPGTFAAHTWGNWSAWGSISGTHHRQSRTCTTAGCGHVQHNDQPHRTSAWWNNSTAGHCTRSCQDCGVHLEHVAHAHSAWTDIHDGTNCVINCTRCGAAHLHVANHWNHASGWRDNHDGAHCYRVCTLCNRYLGSQGHTWGAWGHGDAWNHTRTCTSCSRHEAHGHAWGNWGSINATQHRRTCSVCSRQEHGSHNGDSYRFTRHARDSDRVYRHTIHYDCSVCGYQNAMPQGTGGCLFSSITNRCIGFATNVESLTGPGWTHIVVDGWNWWYIVSTDNRCGRTPAPSNPVQGILPHRNPVVPFT